MKKVYVLMELYTYEYYTDTRVSVYADKEEAVKVFKERVEEEKENSWINSFNEENLIVNYDEDKFEFNVYPEGEAAEYETTIMVLEKEIL